MELKNTNLSQVFRVEIPQGDVDDLKSRLARTRWPAELPNADWKRGVPSTYLRKLAEYWRTDYDWRKHEASLNQFPQFTTTIDGQRIHYLHVSSPEPHAVPLLLIHGWPGSVLEFLELIGPLTNPSDHGGNARDAFHVVIPSLPGHGFSTPLSSIGWNHLRIAKAFTELMARLGYERYGAHGGDVGAFVAPLVGQTAPDHVIGVHVNSLVTFPAGTRGELEDLTVAEQQCMQRLQRFQEDMMGYIHIQGTRPQTLAYGLADSPVGQLGWISEKFKEWTDPISEFAENTANWDPILTGVSLYWFTNTGGTSANLYYETAHDPTAWAPKARGSVPTGVLVSLNQDIAIRRLAERDHNVVHWTECDRGGHFFAMEQPELLVDDIRVFFGRFR